MSEPTGADGAAPTIDPNVPEFSLQSVYLKDVSFEAPRGPRLDSEWNPQVSLELNTGAEQVGENLHEVVLTISLTVKNGEQTAFLVEVKQAGLFGVRNLPEEDYRRAVASLAPGVLFPYARSVIASLVTQGGFPQMLLPPMNFEAMYLQSMLQAQQQATLNS